MVNELLNYKSIQFFDRLTNLPPSCSKDEFYNSCGFSCFMKVPLSSSAKASSNSFLVFMTIGPPQATGSLNGFAADQKKFLAPFGPAFTRTSSMSVPLSDEADISIAQVFSSKVESASSTASMPSIRYRNKV